MRGMARGPRAAEDSSSTLGPILAGHLASIELRREAWLAAPEQLRTAALR